MISCCFGARNTADQEVRSGCYSRKLTYHPNKRWALLLVGLNSQMQWTNTGQSVFAIYSSCPKFQSGVFQRCNGESDVTLSQDTTAL